MDTLKRKVDTPKDPSQKKRRGKPPTSIAPVPVPIATSQTIARIGLQFFLSPDESTCGSQHLELLSAFDLFMLSLHPFYNISPSDGTHPPQISPTLSTFIPPYSSFSKIAELLAAIKNENRENSSTNTNCYICLPSTATKKQQRVILVLEPPSPPTRPSFSLPLFASFVRQVMDRSIDILDLEVVVKIDVGTNEGIDSEWQAWSTINECCNFHPKLLLALDIKSATFSYEALRNRWKGENVKMVIFSNSLLPETTKFPPPLKNLLGHFAKFVKCFVVQGKLPTASEGLNNFIKFQKYLAMRVVNRNKVYGLEQNFLEPYLDKLQIPLQPLEENLTPEVYNVFEKCPVKYRKYQDAIYLSLRARKMVVGKRVVVMVVGAGRGPLVLQTIVASQRARRPVKIYALDKNPHAIRALQELQWKKQWEADEVVIVDADMRTWEPPEKADILVSELLGSFGDNELSPECLDAAQKFLAEDGISIPFQYNSFLAPISSSILYNEVLNIVQHVRKLAENNNNTANIPDSPNKLQSEINIERNNFENGVDVENNIENNGENNVNASYENSHENSFDNGIDEEFDSIDNIDGTINNINSSALDIDHFPTPAHETTTTTNTTRSNIMNINSIINTDNDEDFAPNFADANDFSNNILYNYTQNLEQSTPTSGEQSTEEAELGAWKKKWKRKDNKDKKELVNGNGQERAARVRQIVGIPPDYYFEVGYVVKMDNVLFLDDSKKCFAFSHPNRTELVIDNSRHSQIWFQPKMDGLLHGFAGFFEALLHEKIGFSTNPPNNDQNLVAWFPIYFPLKDPIIVRKGTQVEVNFWRKCSNEKVWYEWCVGNPEDPAVFIHNSQGRAYSMKL